MALASNSIWTVEFRLLSIHPCSPSSTTKRTRIHRFRITNGIPKEVLSRTQQLKQHCITSVSQFHRQLVTSIPMPQFLVNRKIGSNLPIWACVVAVMILVASLRRIFSRKKERPGSVADLVRRGQLRSDRRGISRDPKYEDPFDNPLVKVSKNKSSVEMCGKVYRLAPVTLTQEEQTVHQRRRSRAYQWKRPTVFLKEGDSVPPDVDPDTIRWIPANHPFATTSTDIGEDFAHKNVSQKSGVPFRIQAEHEALQKKLEALQNEEELNKVVINPTNAKESERPFNSNAKLNDHAEKSSLNNQMKDPPSKLDNGPNHFPSTPEDQNLKL
ncbi:protein MULTIPLE CHLOROPLAST DIVISION SITE 1 [Vicia villosa]|uniref:protein MULTIPLE CHLOROPLAST DIVISION SITE 1 n=1 Tax=Vicia villosa TaxID=3911 RepID=UPI00273CD848|nr:protein MULTIPLE CHLOROPLAST DIVISION SITE 1 [Vicia villosa]